MCVSVCVCMRVPALVVCRGATWNPRRPPSHCINSACVRCPVVRPEELLDIHAFLWDRYREVRREANTLRYPQDPQLLPHIIS